MNSTDHENQGNSDELFASLFKNAATRTRAPADDEARIHATLHTEWRQALGRRRWRRLTVGLAAAASVVLAIFVSTGVFNDPPVQTPTRTVASVVKQSGRVLVGTGGTLEAMQRLRAEETLLSGMVISTAYDARLALRWLGGESIRLDENTRLRLISETEMELLSGRIYIDTHADDSQPIGTSELAINTPFGRVQHLGTRYMTSLTHASVIVSVRQGSVAVTGNNEESIATSGQQLSVSSKGNVSLAPIAVFGETWQWVEEISPGFTLDGRSLSDFLDWVSRESGRSLEYGSAAAKTLARDTVMHGTIDLQPMRALKLMLQTSDLVAEVHTGVIKIDTE